MCDDVFYRFSKEECFAVNLSNSNNEIVLDKSLSNGIPFAKFIKHRLRDFRFLFEEDQDFIGVEDFNGQLVVESSFADLPDCPMNEPIRFKVYGKFVLVFEDDEGLVLVYDASGWVPLCKAKH